MPTSRLPFRALDDFDRRILRAILEEPTVSVAKLSEMVGLSQTPCWRRLKRLQVDGVIVGRATILNPKKVGFPINVLAHIRLSKHDETTLEALEREVLVHSRILDCFSMSGESDYVMRVVAADMDDYEQFLKKVLLHLPGVASVNSSFTLKTVKATTKLPV